MLFFTKPSNKGDKNFFQEIKDKIKIFHLLINHPEIEVNNENWNPRTVLHDLVQGEELYSKYKNLTVPNLEEVMKGKA